MSSGTILLQLLVSGILVGGVYSLIAMGFVITYRSAGVFNIAYGQFAVYGAYFAWTFLGSAQEPRLPLALGLFLTLVSAIAFGLTVEFVLFRRLVGKPLFVGFMVSLGLLAVLHGTVVLIWGQDPRSLATTIPVGPIRVGELALAREYVWSFALALAAGIGFYYFFKRSRLGLAMRAAFDDQVAARLLGVSASMNAQIAWVLCAVIATIGGILLAVTSGVSPMLSNLALVVLAVVLIGGMDSLVGCIYGGIILAVGTNLAAFYLGPYLSGIEGVFGMLLILVVLLFRPAGLMGSRPIERV